MLSSKKSYNEEGKLILYNHENRGKTRTGAESGHFSAISAWSTTIIYSQSVCGGVKPDWFNVVSKHKKLVFREKGEML